MKKPAKTGMLTAALVLLGASVAGCGGDAPADATEKEFCASLTSLFEDVDLTEEPSEKEAITAIKAWGEDLEKVGTPEKIPDEARDGFDLMIDQIAGLDEDDTTADFEKLDADMSDEERAASDAFEKYSADACGAMELETPEIPTPSS